MPQRARMPYFTNVKDIDESLVLPDMVVGRMTETFGTQDPAWPWRTLIAGRDHRSLISGISDTFFAPDDGSFWHAAFDLALNSKRHGDRAGFALGRIGRSWVERETDPLNPDQTYERVMRTFEIPLVAQIAAPVGEQIYLGAITRLILQLKYERGFNITSFSSDSFQSADLAQQLMIAGMVTDGLRVDPDSGEIVGTPKSFSVDGRATAPYRELLEGCAERRVFMPRYGALRKELRELEMVAAGYAPDHPVGGAKDCADAACSAVGYLSAFGHQELAPAGVVLDRRDLEAHYGVEPVAAFGPPDEDDEQWGVDVGFGP